MSLSGGLSSTGCKANKGVMLAYMFTRPAHVVRDVDVWVTLEFEVAIYRNCEVFSRKIYIKLLLIVFWWGFILCYHYRSLELRWFGWSAYIHPRLVWGQVCGSCSRRRRRWEVWRTGQAGVFRKKLN